VEVWAIGLKKVAIQPVARSVTLLMVALSYGVHAFRGTGKVQFLVVLTLLTHAVLGPQLARTPNLVPTAALIATMTLMTSQKV